MPKVIVLHAYYGCDTGCCGHLVEIDGEQVGTFDFGHPDLMLKPDSERDKNMREYVRDLVTKEAGKEHVKDIDWDNCIVLDD